MLSDAKPPIPDDTVAEIFGILSPMTILAFSLLRTRMRGLASVVVSPSVLLALSVALIGPVVIVLLFRPRSWSIVSTLPSNDVSGENPSDDGQLIPRSITLLRLISSTSTSSITSGSGTSCSATSCVAMRIASGLSRRITRFSFSSTTTSRLLRIVLNVLAMDLASAFARKNVLTVISWYSRSLAATFG